MAASTQSGRPRGRSGARSETSDRQQTKRAAQHSESPTWTLSVPWVTVELRRPGVTLPQLGGTQLAEAAAAARDQVTDVVGKARSQLPPREQVAYLGGLGVLGAVGMIEWPVALAVGAGAVVLGRAVQRSSQPPAAE